MITEKHLYLALESFVSSPKDSKLSDLAFSSIIEYVAAQLPEEDMEELTSQCLKLVTDHILNDMIFHGLLEETVDGELQLTTEGEKEAEKCDDITTILSQHKSK